MEKKRKIDGYGSGASIAKKKKNLINEDNPVELNTLVAMPDHILEKILGYLELEDKKSFSECCKTLNNIFSCRSNMKIVWLKVQENQKYTEVSRPYANMFWPCVGWANRGAPGGIIGVQKTIPKLLWKRLAPNLTAFHINSSTEDDYLGGYHKCALNLKKLFDCLPFFENLTHLDLVFGSNVDLEHLLSCKHPDVTKTITVKNLQVLKISYELFFFFHVNNYIDFDIKKLQTLIIGNCFDNCLGLSSVLNFNNIRSLISNQSELQKLHLLGGHINGVFNFPFKVQSQLEEFKLAASKQYEFNSAQQDNLYDFVQSQGQFKLLECNFKLANKSEKMKCLARAILNRPLKFQRLKITENLRETNWCEKYSMEEMNEISLDPANLLTRKLELVIDNTISSTNQSQIIPIVVTKFPNLTSLEIVVGSKTPTAHNDILAALNNLQNLETLELTEIKSQYLRTISIIHLKRFVVKDYSYYLDHEAADLIDFIQRHQSLEEISLTSIDIVKDESPTNLNVVENALRLKKLSRFTFKSSLDWGRSDISRQTKSLIISWIEKHSKPGLIFSISPFDLMKRYDNKIMEKVEGRWEPACA